MKRIELGLKGRGGRLVADRQSDPAEYLAGPACPDRDRPSRKLTPTPDHQAQTLQILDHDRVTWIDPHFRSPVVGGGADHQPAENPHSRRPGLDPGRRRVLLSPHGAVPADRKSTRLNSSHYCESRMPS